MKTSGFVLESKGAKGEPTSDEVKVEMYALFTVIGNNTARKSTSGRLSLPLSPQLAARQSRPRTVSGPGVPVTGKMGRCN